MSLLPGHTYHRILCVARMLEIHMKQRVIVRELEVTRPNQRIRINGDDLLGHQVLRLAQRTNNRRIADLAGLVYPECIYARSRAFRIGATSHVEFVALRQRLIQVHPFVAIVQRIGIERTVRIIHRFQGIDHVLFLAIPRHFLLPVDTVVVLVELLVTGLNGVIGQTCLNQVSHRNRVANPVYELMILRVGDLRLIHPESVHGHHHHIVRLLKNSRLCVGTHHEGTFLNKQHTIRISLLKTSRFACSHKLSRRLVAAYHQRNRSD